jgi:UDP-N-acetylmuramoyl-tripeptide--D-alanyl-D-alanine ligase
MKKYGGKLMQKLTFSDILGATSGELICGNVLGEFCNISTDSRKISSGDLFIPIAGEKFDGHDYIISAFSAGAEAVVTHKYIEPIPFKTIIQVKDTLIALREIAAFYRRKFNIPFIGITGSVGKTSTKDMIASVLKEKYKVLKTEGNFNNEIGLPLTVFNLDNFHEAAVLEMGMSGFGEISNLTYIAKPDIAVITNIGVSHIEKLGSRQNILKAKMEILEGLNEKGLLVLNGDDKLLYGLKDLLKFRTIYYGMEEGLDYQAYNIKTAGENGTYFEITIKNTDYKIHIPIPGVHNVYNALAAIAIGIELKLPIEKIIRGISEFTNSKMRMDIITCKEVKIINDTYNASPQSMEAAINVLADIGGNKRKIAILGDMLEMGAWAYKAHMDIGKFAVSKAIDYILTVGENAKHIALGAIEAGAENSTIFSFENNSQLNNYLDSFLKKDDVILGKGSRGMKREEIVHYLCSIDI